MFLPWAGERLYFKMVFFSLPFSPCFCISPLRCTHLPSPLTVIPPGPPLSLLFAFVSQDLSIFLPRIYLSLLCVQSAWSHSFSKYCCEEGFAVVMYSHLSVLLQWLPKNGIGEMFQRRNFWACWRETKRLSSAAQFCPTWPCSHGQSLLVEVISHATLWIRTVGGVRWLEQLLWALDSHV